MLAHVFECKDPKTIRSRIALLVSSGDVDDRKDFLSLNIKNENGNGAVKTTIYNLTVFNKLAMTFIDNPRAIEMRKAFNDVLIKAETKTNKSTEIKPYIENNMIVMPNFNDPIAAAKRLSDGCVFQNLVKYYKNNDRPSDNNNQHIERSLF